MISKAEVTVVNRKTQTNKQTKQYKKQTVQTKEIKINKWKEMEYANAFSPISVYSSYMN